MRYKTLRATFGSNGNDGWYVSDKFTSVVERVDSIDDGIEFNRFDAYRDKELYFIPSKKIMGNKVRELISQSTLVQ